MYNTWQTVMWLDCNPSKFDSTVCKQTLVKSAPQKKQGDFETPPGELCATTFPSQQVTL